jgi:hypothetical protein
MIRWANFENNKLWKRGGYLSLIFAILLLTGAICFLCSGTALPWLVSSQQSVAKDFQQTLLNVSNAFLTCGGWFLAFAGLLFAGHQASRGWMLDVLQRLHVDEGSREQGEAKRLIAEASKALGSNENPYSGARNYLDRLANDRSKLNEFQDARRRLAHFWLRAAKLIEWGVLSKRELFDNFELDIVVKLEPFETITAEDFRDLSKPKPWPAMELYIDWLKQRKDVQQAEEWRPTLPARPDLYQEYRRTSATPGSTPTAVGREGGSGDVGEGV